MGIINKIARSIRNNVKTISTLMQLRKEKKRAAELETSRDMWKQKAAERMRTINGLQKRINTLEADLKKN